MDPNLFCSSDDADNAGDSCLGMVLHVLPWVVWLALVVLDKNAGELGFWCWGCLILSLEYKPFSVSFCFRVIFAI